MYSELYEIWTNERQSSELGKLSSDFYDRAVAYLKKLKEEGRMLDKRTVKARLLRREAQNVRLMLREIVDVRYSKLMRKTAEAEKVSSDFLTGEEEKLLTGVLPLAEGYQAFVKNLLQGRLTQTPAERSCRHAVLRFVKDVPAIIGADMKPYGPFVTEDVASLPVENAKILIKQGFAQKIETN